MANGHTPDLSILHWSCKVGTVFALFRAPWSRWWGGRCFDHLEIGPISPPCVILPFKWFVRSHVDVLYRGSKQRAEQAVKIFNEPKLDRSLGWLCLWTARLQYSLSGSARRWLAVIQSIRGSSRDRPEHRVEGTKPWLFRAKFHQFVDDQSLSL